LKLTGCGDDEFTCADATCVAMSVRCDAKGDCSDGSDEADCKAIMTPIGYHRSNVPPPNGRHRKLQVSTDIHLIQIVGIDEKQGYFKSKVGFSSRWVDKQLVYQNLKRNYNNVITPEDMDIIWRPHVVYENIEHFGKVIQSGDKRIIKIDLNAEFHYTQAGNDNIDNTYLFEGSENSLEYIRYYTIEWLCDFNMAWYPFDTQSCTMQLKNNLADWVDFVPRNFTYTGPMNLQEYHIRDFRICSAEVAGRKGIVAEVVFNRPLLSHLITITLPTTILVLLSQTTTTFSQHYLDMVISVNLTVLLVLATL
jgi:hypothetical protein